MPRHLQDARRGEGVIVSLATQLQPLLQVPLAPADSSPVNAVPRVVEVLSELAQCALPSPFLLRLCLSASYCSARSFSGIAIAMLHLVVEYVPTWPSAPPAPPSAPRAPHSSL